MHRKTSTLLALGLLTALAAVGAATGQGAQPERKELRIGYLPNIVLPQPLIGLVKGGFEKQVPGVKFSGQAFPAGPAVLEALRAGTIDIAYTGPYPPMNAFLKDRDVVLLVGAATGGTELLVSKASSIKTVADLKGKVVGINQLGSTVDVIVRYNLIEAGLVPDKDVRLIEVPPAEQAEALKRNEVAAVASPAPWPSYIVKNGNGRPLLNWHKIFDGGNYLQGVGFTTRKFAQANPNLVAAFVKAHRAITTDLNKNRAKGDKEVLDAWSQVTKRTLDPAVASAAFASIKYTNSADVKSFERLADVTFQAGILRQKGSFDGFLYAPGK
jgi:NitT/TauT family transport system substrate-binding protein